MLRHFRTTVAAVLAVQLLLGWCCAHHAEFHPSAAAASPGATSVPSDTPPPDDDEHGHHNCRLGLTGECWRPAADACLLPDDCPSGAATGVLRPAEPHPQRGNVFPARLLGIPLHLALRVLLL